MPNVWMALAVVFTFVLHPVNLHKIFGLSHSKVAVSVLVKTIVKAVLKQILEAVPAGKKTFDFNSMATTTTDSRNPFREWNLLFLPYCDGSMWAAQRTSASAETFGLWFSGHNTIVAMLDYFSPGTGGSLNLNDDQTFIVFSGDSAGGFGVWTNLDYMASRLPFATVVGAPIGGFPPRVNWYTGWHSYIPEEDGRNSAWGRHVKLYDSYLNIACKNHYRYNSSLCTVPYIMYPFIQQPVFIIEALTDSVVTCEFEGLACSAVELLNKEVKSFLNGFAQNLTKKT